MINFEIFINEKKNEKQNSKVNFVTELKTKTFLRLS